jgi:protein ImuB
MFACIHGRSVFKSPGENGLVSSSLVDLAFTFSPLVEQTTADTVVFDISGQDLLFGEAGACEIDARDAAMASANNLTNEIVRRAQELGLAINVSVAMNPDASIHAARSFKGTTIINIGDEGVRLGTLSIKQIDFSLAGIDGPRAEEIQETFSLWGCRTFGDLARLPLAGVAERLGKEGVRLRKLAQGKTVRHLNLVRPPIGFEQSLELEHAVEELEPLSFILSRLLNQLCANLIEHALATNELKLRLHTEPGASVTNSNTCTESPAEDLEPLHERTITLPVPMRNPKTLLRLLLFDIEAQPPKAPIVSVTISAEPVKPRASQTGLFIPLAPEPEKLEITLARLAKLVGQDHVGSPELLDTHRPDSFRMKRFQIAQTRRKSRKNSSRFALNAGETPALPVMGFRVFRPPWRADVETIRGQPARINARGRNSFNRVRGKVGCAAGPWRSSGDWWRPDVWARDEWDVAVVDANNQQGEVLYRIYRDLTSDEWFVAGVYD